jgi:hypothetical protein
MHSNLEHDHDMHTLPTKLAAALFNFLPSSAMAIILAANPTASISEAEVSGTVQAALTAPAWLCMVMGNPT